MDAFMYAHEFWTEMKPNPDGSAVHGGPPSECIQFTDLHAALNDQQERLCVRFKVTLHLSTVESADDAVNAWMDWNQHFSLRMPPRAMCTVTTSLR